MTQKKVIVSDCVRRDLEIITDMVMQMTSADFAERYARRIEAEISKLSYMATVLPDAGGFCRCTIILRPRPCLSANAN